MRYVHGLRGDDDADDEYLDRTDADKTENDPDASDPAREQRGGAVRPNQTPMTMQERSRMQITSDSSVAALPAGDHVPSGTHVVVMKPEALEDMDRESGHLTTRATVTRPSETVFFVFPQVGTTASTDEAREIVADILALGLLTTPGGQVQVSESDGDIEPVRPAPFDQDDAEPEYRPRRTSVMHESDQVVLELAESRVSRSVFLEAQRPDWALDPDVDTWAAVLVTGVGASGRADVEVNADTPEDLRNIAAFFNAAAGDLEKTQAAVKAAQAEVITD